MRTPLGLYCVGRLPVPWFSNKREAARAARSGGRKSRKYLRKPNKLFEVIINVSLAVLIKVCIIKLNTEPIP